MKFTQRFYFNFNKALTSFNSRFCSLAYLNLDRSMNQRDMATWESLRSQARALENQIDEKIVAFSNTHSEAYDAARFDGMAQELQQLLYNLSNVNDRMREVVGDSPSASIAHTVSRHNGLLSDMQHEFARIKVRLGDARNKAELLSSVQRDINTYRNDQARREELLMKEGAHLANTRRGVEETIEIGLRAKEELYKQQGILGRASSKLSMLIHYNRSAN